MARVVPGPAGRAKGERGNIVVPALSFERVLLPSLEGRGRGWVGTWGTAVASSLANPPPTPPFQGGELESEGFNRASIPVQLRIMAEDAVLVEADAAVALQIVADAGQVGDGVMDA